MPADVVHASAELGRALAELTMLQHKRTSATMARERFESMAKRKQQARASARQQTIANREWGPADGTPCPCRGPCAAIGPFLFTFMCVIFPISSCVTIDAKLSFVTRPVAPCSAFEDTDILLSIIPSSSLHPHGVEALLFLVPRCSDATKFLSQSAGGWKAP